MPLVSRAFQFVCLPVVGAVALATTTSAWAQNAAASYAGADVYRPPQIAIVFDDLGYSTRGLARELLELPVRLTFAVLPDLPHSAAFAESAMVQGHEVILHVPMEPLDLVRHDPGRDPLLVDLAPSENVRRLRRHLDALPFYSGVSNHMGSRLTSRPELVELVLREVRDRDHGLFFLDSRTTPHSVVAEEARVLGLPCLTNNMFLDSIEPGARAPAVKTRLLADIAHRRGHAIAIGHLHRETVEAVKAAIPIWRASGIRLVVLSDLMHRGAGEVSTR